MSPEKVYQDEPILFTTQQMENYTPPKYLAMRKIAKSNWVYHESDAKIFYEQGKFMEDFEDDYDYQGEFAQYFPTYQSMSDRQLRGYFSWRTKVRRGSVEKTSLSFVFVYIYELINRIGVRSAEDGFHALKNFWTAYKEIDFRINRYVRLWLKDYVVYNNLDKSLLADFRDASFNDAVLTLFSYKLHGADEVFSALNSLSSYDLGNSRFFKRHPEDVKNVTYAVFSAVSDYYEKNCKDAFYEKFFGRVYAGSYTMFSSAVFYDQTPHKNFVYEVNDLCKYTCKNSNWSCERFFCYGGKGQLIGPLLKTIDFLMRRKYNFKSALKVGKTAKTLQNIIGRAIDEYLEKQRENARPKVDIDVSKLSNIRKAALETQDKLLAELVEELEEADVSVIFDNGGPSSYVENDFGLSDTEYLFMKCLLYGQAYDDLIRSKGLPLSVLVDAVNERFFDRFGDTVIVEAAGRPELVEDYVEELKGIIGE